MKKLLLFTLLLTTLPFSLLADDDAIINGKNHYIKANCQKCHNLDNNYDPKKSKVTDHGQLVGWVNSCSSFFKIGWDSFHEEEVSEYLNKIHYKFHNE